MDFYKFFVIEMVDFSATKHTQKFKNKKNHHVRLYFRLIGRLFSCVTHFWDSEIDSWLEFY